MSFRSAADVEDAQSTKQASTLRTIVSCEQSLNPDRNTFLNLNLACPNTHDSCSVRLNLGSQIARALYIEEDIDAGL